MVNCYSADCNSRIEQQNVTIGRFLLTIMLISWLKFVTRYKWRIDFPSWSFDNCIHWL